MTRDRHPPERTPGEPWNDGEYDPEGLIVLNDEKKLCGVVSLSDLARIKHTNRFVNEILYEISIPNPQTEKPLKYLEVDDFPL